MAKEAQTSEVAYSREEELVVKVRELAQKEGVTQKEIAETLDDFLKSYESLLSEIKLLTSVGDRLQRKLKQANALERAQREEIKRQAEELQDKNVALQTTLDELSKAKASRKAQAFILILAVVLFVGTEAMERLFDTIVDVDTIEGFLISNGLKVLMVLGLKPLEGYLERYFVRQSMDKDKRELVDKVTAETGVKAV
jgi:DNA-binding transcriptional MerR regulator